MRPASYQAAIALVRRHFTIRPGYDVALLTKELDVCRGVWLLLTEDVWKTVGKQITDIAFEEEKVAPTNEAVAASAVKQKPDIESVPSQASPVDTHSQSEQSISVGLRSRHTQKLPRMTVTVFMTNTQRQPFIVKPTTAMRKLLKAYAETTDGLGENQLRFVYDKRTLEPNDTPNSVKMTTGARIDVYQKH